MHPKAVATVVIFIISIFFVVQRVKIPICYGRHITLNLLTGPLIAIAILWASQCIDGSTIRDGIVGTDGVKPYNILILFFSLAYMSITLDVTGVLKAAAHWVSNVSGRSATKLYINFYFMVTALSAILGNDPVILTGTLFLLYYTEANDLDGMPWLMTEFAAANTASMILFVGNPTNVVICEGFGIENASFTAYTILPFVACSLTSLLALFFQFRVFGGLPRKLLAVQKFDVRKDITDLVSAVVGGVLLGGCLITALVVSFLHIDVWKITLPFASAKLIFDIVWGFYITRRGKKGDEEQKFMTPPAMRREIANSVTTQITIAQPDAQHKLTKAPAPQTEMEEHRKKSGDSASRADYRPLPTAHVATDQVTPENKSAANDILPNGHTDESSASGTTDSGTVHGEAPQDDLDNHNTPPTSHPTIEGNTISAPEPNKKNKLPPLLDAIFETFGRGSDYVAQWFKTRQPTLYAAFPRLPFALVPFAFSQFILIEALNRQGWIDIFARWLVIASGKRMFPIVWIVGIIGVILCNIAGTNIGATILLTKIVRAADLPHDSNRAAGVALALASNIGAVSFVFSASLAGLLWKQIIDTQNEKSSKKTKITQRMFAKWNLLPLSVMTSIGLAVVSAEVAFLYRSHH
jgi:Na+/H+ antiporter NhaD/arsenite permease-like protein